MSVDRLAVTEGSSAIAERALDAGNHTAERTTQDLFRKLDEFKQAVVKNILEIRANEDVREQLDTELLQLLQRLHEALQNPAGEKYGTRIKGELLILKQKVEKVAAKRRNDEMSQKGGVHDYHAINKYDKDGVEEEEGR